MDERGVRLPGPGGHFDAEEVGVLVQEGDDVVVAEAGRGVVGLGLERGAEADQVGRQQEDEQPAHPSARSSGAGEPEEQSTEHQQHSGDDDAGRGLPDAVGGRDGMCL
jgi:hypothetical protein